MQVHSDFNKPDCLNTIQRLLDVCIYNFTTQYSHATPKLRRQRHRCKHLVFIMHCYGAHSESLCVHSDEVYMANLTGDGAHQSFSLQ